MPHSCKQQGYRGFNVAACLLPCHHNGILCTPQVLALELLMILLENSGEVFRTSEKFSSAIKQYLCLSLLKNCTSSIPQAFALSCSIFLTLMAKFRHSLKAEIGVFFPMIMLKAIEAPQVPVGTPFGETAFLSTRNYVWCLLHMFWKLSCMNTLLLTLMTGQTMCRASPANWSGSPVKRMHGRHRQSSTFGASAG